MSTNPPVSSSAAAELRVDLLLRPPELLEHAGSALQDELHTAVSQLLRTLGIPASVELRLTAGPARDGDDRRPLELRVDGQASPVPDDVLAVSYDLVKDSPADGGHTRRGPPPSDLLALAPAACRAFVVDACVQTLQRSPAALLTDAAAAGYLAELSQEGDAAGLPTDAPALARLLRAVLRLRISVRDRSTVARILREGAARQAAATDLEEALIAALRLPELRIELSPEYLHELSTEHGSADQSPFRPLREGLFHELGLRLPAIRLSPAEDVPPGCFRFRINDLPTPTRRGLRTGEYLVGDTAERLAAHEVDARPARDPASADAACIVSAGNPYQLRELGFTPQDGIEYLVRSLRVEARTLAECFIDRDVVRRELDALAQAFPDLVEAARARIPIERLTATIRYLLDEEVSVRDLRRVLQALVDYDHVVVDSSAFIVFDPRLNGRIPPGEDWTDDPVTLAGAVRIALKRQLSHQYSGGGTMVVYLLHPDIEQLLLAEAEGGTAVPPERILDAVRSAIADAPAGATSAASDSGATPTTADTASRGRPPVLLTTSDVRPRLRAIVAAEFPDLAVVSYSELAPDVSIQPLARIEMTSA